MAGSSGLPEPQLARARGQFVHEPVVDVLVHQQARRRRVHISPLLPKMPQNAAFTAASKSASGKTMLGDLPPSSRLRRLRFETAEFCSSLRAVAMLPVKLILSTSSCSASASPVVWPYPVTTLSDALRQPRLARRSRAKRSAFSGVSSEGFSTTEQPHASAGATFHAAICSGKFHGTIAPTTPTGSRSV